MSDTFSPPISGYLSPPFPPEAPYGAAIEYNPPPGTGIRFRFLPPEIFIALSLEATEQTMNIRLPNFTGITNTYFELYMRDLLNPQLPFIVVQDSDNGAALPGSLEIITWHNPLPFIPQPDPGFRIQFAVGSEDLLYSRDFYVVGQSGATAIQSQIIHFEGVAPHS